VGYETTVEDFKAECSLRILSEKKVATFVTVFEKKLVIGRRKRKRLTLDESVDGIPKFARV